jgi:hypothetical protein
LRAIWEGNSCLLSRGAPDTVRCGFLSLIGEADRWQPESRWRTRHVRCTPDSPVPPSSRWLGHVSHADRAASPVNYSRTSPTISRERPVRPSQSGAPDTVRCTTGHCLMHHRTVRCSQTEQSLGCSSQDNSNVLFLFPAL